MRGGSRRIIEQKRWVVDFGLPTESAMDEDADLIETVSPLIQSPAKDLPQDTRKDASSGKDEDRSWHTSPRTRVHCGVLALAWHQSITEEVRNQSACEQKERGWFYHLLREAPERRPK